MTKTIFLLSLWSALLALPMQAATLQTFNFTGVCTDCEGSVTATLTLQNYTLGTPITNENFSELFYGGSNLLPAFFISKLMENFTFAEGSIPAGLPGFANVSVFGTEHAFFSGVEGSWNVGIVIQIEDPGDGFVDLDFGGQGTWNGTAVPEPGSMALLGSAGLALLALRRRR
jgi:hypothetical protein